MESLLNMFDYIEGQIEIRMETLNESLNRIKAKFKKSKRFKPSDLVELYAASKHNWRQRKWSSPQIRTDNIGYLLNQPLIDLKMASEGIRQRQSVKTFDISHTPCVLCVYKDNQLIISDFELNYLTILNENCECIGRIEHNSIDFRQVTVLYSDTRDYLYLFDSLNCIIYILNETFSIEFASKMNIFTFCIHTDFLYTLTKVSTMQIYSKFNLNQIKTIHFENNLRPINMSIGGGGDILKQRVYLNDINGCVYEYSIESGHMVSVIDQFKLITYAIALVEPYLLVYDRSTCSLNAYSKCHHHQLSTRPNTYKKYVIKLQDNYCKEPVTSICCFSFNSVCLFYSNLSKIIYFKMN